MGISSAPPSLFLVNETIAQLRSAGAEIVVVCGPGSPPRPLTAAQRDAIDRANITLPASVSTWLEFDAAALDLFDAEGCFAITSLTEFFLQELEELADELDDDMLAEARESVGYMFGDYAGLADHPCLVLPGSASQAHLLVLDGSAEPPVLGYEKEELWEKYPSFGACIAHLIGNRDYEDIAPDWYRQQR